MPLLPHLAIDQLPANARAELRSGMRSPAVRVLPAGMALYRFASSWNPWTKQPTDRGQCASGPWWIDADGYALICAQQAASLRAHQGDPARALSLGFLARLAAAVKQEWSQVDVLVTAHVAADVHVFAGRGRAQHEVPDPTTGFWRYSVRFTWTGWDAITQYYLPGLDRDHPGHLRPGYPAPGDSPDRPKALDIGTVEPIPSQQPNPRRGYVPAHTRRPSAGR